MTEDLKLECCMLMMLRKLVTSFGGTSALEQTPNLLSYPASKYANLVAGFPSG